MAWGLDPVTSKRLDELGYRAGATFYIVRLAGVVPVLAALTGRDDAVVGGIFTNRNRLACERMFGCFANLVTIGLGADWDLPYRAFIARVRGHVVALQANAEIPRRQLGEEMAALGIAVPPLPVLMHVRTPHPPIRLAGMQLAWRSAASPMRHAIVIGFDQFAEATNCFLSFDARLYDRETIEVLRSSLVRFFDAAAADPDLPLGAVIEQAGVRPIQRD
jgi:hypothetical protein